MARPSRGSRLDTWKSKKWYTILSPEHFGHKPIGQTPASDPSTLIGRTVETTLAEFDGDYSKQHIKLKFRIFELAGDTAHTQFIGHDLTRDYARSLVRRRTSKVDTNVLVETKDGVKVRIKTSAFTISRVDRSQIRAIRRILEEFIKKRVSELTLDELTSEVLSGKLSSSLYREGKRVHPLRRVEMRRMEIEYPDMKATPTTPNAPSA